MKPFEIKGYIILSLRPKKGFRIREPDCGKIVRGGMARHPHWPDPMSSQPGKPERLLQPDVDLGLKTHVPDIFTMDPTIVVRVPVGFCLVSCSLFPRRVKSEQ